jgi:cytochrome c peroxidase
MRAAFAIALPLVAALRIPPALPNRRVLLSNGAALATGAVASSFAFPMPALAAGPDYAGAKAALQGLIKEDQNLIGTMVRLAWHSSGTYDKMTKTGGSGGGTIRFKEELAHGGNAGLDKMVAKLEPVHAKFSDVSYADLYTLAGATALEAAFVDGTKVPWKSGRVDAMTPDAVTPDGRLPDASKGNDPQKTAAALRKDVFYRMGFNDQEIVALSGAHALGRCHSDASGYSGPWSPTPTILNNGYFSLLLKVPWTIKEWDGPMQFEDPSGKLMMLPSDLVLIQDKNFRPYAVKYSKDNDLFVKDFLAAYTKLTELGTKNLKAVPV